LGLWRVREGQQRTFGVGGEEAGEWFHDVPADDVATLRRLSEQCGGWWRWSEEEGDEILVPIDEWTAYVQDRHPGTAKDRT
jgi:hypothetical protein